MHARMWLHCNTKQVCFHGTTDCSATFTRAGWKTVWQLRSEHTLATWTVSWWSSPKSCWAHLSAFYLASTSGRRAWHTVSDSMMAASRMQTTRTPRVRHALQSKMGQLARHRACYIMWRCASLRSSRRVGALPTTPESSARAAPLLIALLPSSLPGTICWTTCNRVRALARGRRRAGVSPQPSVPQPRLPRCADRLLLRTTQVRSDPSWPHSRRRRDCADRLQPCRSGAGRPGAFCLRSAFGQSRCGAWQAILCLHIAGAAELIASGTKHVQVHSLNLAAPTTLQPPRRP